MSAASILTMLLALAVQPPAERPNDSQQRRAAAWQALFDRTARAYEFYRDQEHHEQLQLHAAPVYKWKADNGGDDIFGAVYLWTHQGCAENVACFWRNDEGRPLLKHEIHSLSPKVLEAVGAPSRAWKPAAGLSREPLGSAPPPAPKAPIRLAQMRRLAGAFSGYTEAPGDVRRELRLLSTPLYRYESSDPGVLDGALFAFVCTVGTDPEAFLLLEARRTADGPIWHYALARFSHADTFFSFEQKPVWKSVRSVDDTVYHSADYTYVLFGEPVAAEPELQESVDAAGGSASQ
jgi:hypothetical protein